MKTVSHLGRGRGTRPRESAVRFRGNLFRSVSVGILLALGAVSWRTISPAGGQAGPGLTGARAHSTRPKRAASNASGVLQTHRNLGKAYYEQGKYPEAVAEFQKVVASGQALATDHLDLGLALMQANRLDAALGELTTARQMDAKLVAADYDLGILFKRELRYPDAEAALKRVTEADPRDPAAWFNLGAAYFEQKRFEEAFDAFRQVVEMGFPRGQNFYVAALFRTATILYRRKRPEEAQKFQKLHQEVKDKVPNISVQTPALEGGKYGAILVPLAPPKVELRSRSARGVIFADITSRLGIALPPRKSASLGAEALRNIKSSEFALEYARLNIVPVFGGSVALGDYDGDGHEDIFVTVPGGKNRLLRNNGNGAFEDVTETSGRLTGDGASLSATFADYDNSGHASLFVAGLGGVTLFRNKGNGRFVDETEKAGLKGRPGELATRAVLFDADNDGFLDLVVTTYSDLSAPPLKESFAFPDDFAGARVRFYRNNGDGTFSEQGPASGINAEGRWRSAAFADFNNDGFADLLLCRDDGPPVLYLNQGEDRFKDRTKEAGADFSQSRASDVQVADFDHDGNFDLALWSHSGYQVLLNRGDGRFGAVANLPAITPPAGSFDFRGAVMDVNMDGFTDLVAVDSTRKLHLLANHGGKFYEAPLDLPADTRANAAPGDPIAWLASAWLDAPGRLGLVALSRSGKLAAYEKSGSPARWLEVKLNGFKSNTQGVGTVVELKAGNFYDKVLATGGLVRVSIGGLTKLDVVRVTWPNQVIQNATDVVTNKRLEIRESERLASSCPFLYVWNGKRFAFFTDVLGVAPLGELAPDGSYVSPNPEEFVRLPHDLPERQGLYSFRLTDEMREVDYFDRLRLLAVDHPAAEEIYANEIYSAQPAPPVLYAVKEKRFPVAAVDDRGSDVLPLIWGVDGRYPTDFRRNRILGLADTHSLTLDLGEIPDSARVALWLTGWVFWTDSNASRALMTNSQLQMIPPYLQVRDAQGRWVTAIADLGLPSGTNRTMRVDLAGKFLSRDHHVRIVTNFCVYWDQIFFSIDDAPAPAPLALSLVAADLRYRGFSKPTSNPQHLKPDSFDYVRLVRDAPWNPMAGNYTRYGSVESLLGRADDRLVVMATGDELTVDFDGGGLPPLQPGWKRDFFLDAAGYAKDGEPNTAFSKTVEPMPFRKMSGYPFARAGNAPDSAEYRQYLREYQTRRGRLLIPPIAPVARSRQPFKKSFRNPALK